MRSVLEEARDLGFVGPGDLTTSLAQGDALARAIGTVPTRFLELGAGGGVPGLPLLLTWERAHGVLVEAQRRRCRFLGEALATMALTDRAEVRCDRAETLARSPELRGGFELVVARGFAGPAVTAECAVGFLRPAGLLVVTEPPVADPTRWPTAGLAALGLTLEGRVDLGGFGFARLRHRDGMPAARWPRRVPTKRPLW